MLYLISEGTRFHTKCDNMWLYIFLAPHCDKRWIKKEKLGRKAGEHYCRQMAWKQWVLRGWLSCFSCLLPRFSFTRILASTPAPNDKGHKDSQVSAGTPSLSWPPFRSFVHTEQLPYKTLKQTSSLPCPTPCFRSHLFLAPGTGFVEDDFPQTEGVMVSGWFQHSTSIVHFISIIMTPAPPQIIRR